MEELKELITKLEDKTINDTDFDYTNHSPMELLRLEKIVNFIWRKSKTKTCGWRDRK